MATTTIISACLRLNYQMSKIKLCLCVLSDEVKFGEVALHPPALSVLPRHGADKSSARTNVQVIT